MKKPLPKNQRVAIQRLSNVVGVNDFDEPTPDSWEEIAERWAAILSKGHKAFWRSGQETIEATHYLELVFDTDTETITVADRIVWNDRILRILEVSDTENDRRELSIVCRETTGMSTEE